MSLEPVAVVLLAFVGLYPVVSSGLWIAGALVFRLADERSEVDTPPGGWPAVTVLIPAFNEEAVIATSVTAALAADYPALEVLVLDDGSVDDTVGVAERAGAGDARLEVVPDPVNRGKADRLNVGFAQARSGLVVVTDADTHLHPLAVKLLVTRIRRSPLTAAVAGAPHVTNRRNLLSDMQVLEAASIIGLIRRTQAVRGGVGVVAGVLGLFRRDAVLAVGGYRAAMATEDIDLTWRLLLAGWHTAYEPDALVGMEVPSGLKALWAQRRRWARGQGEVLRVHLRQVARMRDRRTWALALEALSSLFWVIAFVVTALVTAIVIATGDEIPAAALGLAWGIAVSLVASIQLWFALQMEYRYDPSAMRAFLVGALYPVAFWMISSAAALRSELPALVRGPTGERVAWDIPREVSLTRRG